MRDQPELDCDRPGSGACLLKQKTTAGSVVGIGTLCLAVEPALN
jgi:hypothetical protein